MACILISGVPKAGKTRLAYRLHKHHLKKSIVLDGDELRNAIKYEGFTKEDRYKWMDIVSDLAVTFEKQGITPIIALVSPYKEARNKIRSKFKDFKLIWIKYNKKYLWKGSNYEEPNNSESPIIIERLDGVEYKIPKELKKWILEVI